ncbi:hypothetical protein K437DRAFT_186642 [Tilletiaria anomala UBC 951]|uniref:Calcineurin-like phosphoesterase domain-containing protein n=1 Tax=Tilletiaria anomala (strain ATCC 24038 / CBS 436.72 / UBC 951) TaxID=1037660 RepID=A0A066WFH7_TILAU|nr:uncharacterized protein K437DRAFT_186642 [Tilletiaria anomala UBC 951]KDN52541.1 hypothetical protein K437DRAFT_186642 [Tilletiaria anomala UBC 951]
MITDYERNHFPAHSYTRKAPAGVGSGSGAAQAGTGSDNYWVPIYGNASAQRGSRPELLLWFFDSRSGKTMKKFNNTQIPDWIDQSVAKWVHSQVDGMQTAWTSVPPSLVFVHIPPHASAETQQTEPYSLQVGGVTDETPQNYTTENRKYPGLNDDSGFEGQGGESPYNYTGQDLVALISFLQSAAGNARVHAIVSGHQHGNDWCAPSNLQTRQKQIVPVCFAKHSGFGGYDYDNWNHGSRIFLFSLKDVGNSMQTYIRFLTGEVRYKTTVDAAWAIP